MQVAEPYVSEGRGGSRSEKTGRRFIFLSKCVLGWHVGGHLDLVQVRSTREAYLWVLVGPPRSTVGPRVVDTLQTSVEAFRPESHGPEFVRAMAFDGDARFLRLLNDGVIATGIADVRVYVRLFVAGGPTSTKTLNT